jgi:hypothetical protein
LLILLGGGATVLGLIVYAIVCKKFWVIPAAGLIVFLGLMACGLFVARIQVASPTQVIDSMSPIPGTARYGLPRVNTYPVGNSAVYVSGANWSKILIVGLLTAFVIGLLIRRGASPAFAHSSRRAWPVVAVILFFGVMYLSRSNDAYDRAQANARAARDAAEQATARAEIQAVREQALAHERSVEKIRAQLKIVPKDIHAEMDQFDAPRIPLSPDKSSPNAPVQPTTVAESNDKSADKTNKGETTKTAATSTNKRKKSDKKPATSESKQAQLIAQSKAAAETAAKKDNSTNSDKAAMVAEAEPERAKVRPAWVDESPKRTGDTRREVIATEEFATVDECYQAVDIYLLLKTYQRLQQLAGRHDVDGPLPSLTFHNGIIFANGTVIYSRGGYWADDRLRHLNNLGINAEYVRREIVAKDPKKNNESREYVDTVERSFGPMKQLFMQIEFTPSIDRDLQAHWDAYERQERFAMFGVGASSILGLLGCVFAVLKIDTVTKGYYTKRLFLGVPLAILGLFCLYAMLIKMGFQLPH